MKQMTIWQRLNIAFALLVLLLMAGGGLALWSEKTGASADAHGAELAGKIDRIYADETTMSDVIRGLLLDPKNEPEKKRWDVAEKDLAENLSFIATNSNDRVEIRNAVHSFENFHSAKMMPLKRHIFALRK